MSRFTIRARTFGMGPLPVRTISRVKGPDTTRVIDRMMTLYSNAELWRTDDDASQLVLVVGLAVQTAHEALVLAAKG